MDGLRSGRVGVRRIGVRRVGLVGLTLLVAAVGLTGTGVAGVTAGAEAVLVGDRSTVEVIARSDGGVGAAEAAVVRLGGVVERRLDLIQAVAARMPARAVDALRATAGVAEVTPNAPVRLKADRWRAGGDVNSLYSLTTAAGAHDVYAMTDAQGRTITGQGVGVALIDSGVAQVKGLTGTGKVINGPDLSFESQSAELRHRDTFGHGTHMAGIIAGRDPEVAVGKESRSKYFMGVAPGAHIVNLKVAAADGAVDVSQVIAAIDWVVAHRNDPGLNIRVLNLSFGTDSVQDARLDPLSYAVEVAWRKGIVVVVSVGNDGPTRARVSMPAANPFVIAVGASDPRGTEVRTDDKVASFSTAGDATRHADIFAPGMSVVSLRDPGSYVDVNYPTAMIPNDLEKRYFRGSGSSQSAAMVSGTVALLLQQRPGLTPDQVKRILMTGRQALPTGAGDLYGAGQIDIKKAIATPTPSYVQTHQPATGLGLLDASRGTARVTDPVIGLDLTGERDIFGQAWNGKVWSANAAAEKAWTGGTWNGNLWAGAGWTGTSWTARTWSAGTWTARTWSGALWSARTWSGASWTAAGWSGGSWTGRTWSGRTWSGGYWS
jgi:serine protease AprX